MFSEKKSKLYREIYSLNNEVKSLDVGLYMAFPHINSIMYRLLYSMMALCENFTIIDDKNLNVQGVVIRDNISVDAKGFIDNPQDVHPNAKGYQVIGLEILRHMVE